MILNELINSLGSSRRRGGMRLIGVQASLPSGYLVILVKGQMVHSEFHQTVILVPKFINPTGQAINIQLPIVFQN